MLSDMNTSSKQRLDFVFTQVSRGCSGAGAVHFINQSSCKVSAAVNKQESMWTVSVLGLHLPQRQS